MLNLDFQSLRKNLIKSDSAWIGLIPFGWWLAKELKPKVFVELGTHWGHSYFTICNSIKLHGIECQCYAIDTWEGDEHTDSYGESVYSYVLNANESYSVFSTLLRGKFASKLEFFQNGSIDLLHIDGLHTYEAVSEDFNTWLPKVSNRGVVLFHDIDVDKEGFGVNRFWNELKSRYSATYELNFSSGLGVLFIDPDDIIYNKLQYDRENQKSQFEAIGSLVKSDYVIRDLAGEYLKSQEQIKSLRNDFDLKISQLQQENLDLRNREWKSQEQIKSLRNDFDLKISQLQQENLDLRNRECAIQNTISWRLTAPLRAVYRKFTAINSLLEISIKESKKIGWFELTKKCVQFTKNNGVREFVNKAKNRRFEKVEGGHQELWLRHYSQDFYRRMDLKGSPRTTGKVLYSVIMPVYNPPIEFLRQSIESVLNQTHQSWELIIVDDCSSDPDVHKLLNYYSTVDERINVIFNENNLGISQTSNIAASIASGEYIALLDNDDLLTHDALSVLDIVVEMKNPDMIYSDECLIDENNVVKQIFAKPDWSEVLMHNCMYVGHFGLYKRYIFEELGGFRREFDFSQDYDLMLRFSRRTKNIHHVESILYGWRMLPSSGSAGGKPHARQSNLAALDDHIKKIDSNAFSYELPCANAVRLNVHAIQTVAIIVPSDNISNIKSTIENITNTTNWINYRIYIVTNSNIVRQLTSGEGIPKVIFVPYDLPYNFSDKCNVGAQAAIEDTLIFYNDDVRALDPNWIYETVQYLNFPGVGIVGPKLIYENGTIQHAGMVTGVRRLVGTAFHCRDHKTNEHFNFAQSVREVSLICGACLAISRKVFWQVNGFDAINFPINHSDVDLCLKVREAGLSCVYNPRTMLLHIGHVSIGAVEKKKKEFKKDPADINLLKIWPSYLARDQYFTQSMARLLYHDSPEYYQIYPGSSFDVGSKSILLVSHDLSNSGAPRVVYNIANLLRKKGFFVVVSSPVDGPLRDDLNKIGITVIIDELALHNNKNVIDFAKNFDAVICNTVLTYDIAHGLADYLNPIFYIHESTLLQSFLSNSSIFETIKQLKDIYCGSDLPREILESHGLQSTLLRYGVYPPEVKKTVTNSTVDNSINVGIFASYEERKGQDLLIEAIKLLNKDVQSKFNFKFFGRTLEHTYHSRIQRLASGVDCITLGGELDYDSYVDQLANCDCIFIPSRSDTLPLVSIDALALGLPVLCSKKCGTWTYLFDEMPRMVSNESTASDFKKLLLNLCELDLSSYANISRRIYAKNFSMQQFEDSLMGIL